MPELQRLGAASRRSRWRDERDQSRPAARSPPSWAATAPHAVLDVRERAAYERGHIYWSTSLPRRLLETRLPGAGHRETHAHRPRRRGRQRGRAGAARRWPPWGTRTCAPSLEGSGGWRAAGRPTVQGLNVPSKVFGERALHEWKTPQVTCPELAQRIARGEDMVIVDSRTPGGVSPRLHSRVGEHARRRAGAAHRRAREAPRPDHRRPLRRAHALLHRRGVAAAHGAAEPHHRARERHHGLAARRPRAGARGRALGAARPPRRGRAVAAEVAKRVAQADGLRGINARRAQGHAGAPGRTENLYVFDVRTTEEYAAGHVAGAVWAPGGQAVQAIDDYLAVRGAQIVFVCDDGSRAALTRRVVQAARLPQGRLSRGRASGLAGGGRRARVRPSHAGAVGARGGAAGRRRCAGRSRRRPSSISVDPSDVYAARTCRARPGSAGAGSRRRIGAVAPDRARRWW